MIHAHIGTVLHSPMTVRHWFIKRITRAEIRYYTAALKLRLAVFIGPDSPVPGSNPITPLRLLRKPACPFNRIGILFYHIEPKQPECRTVKSRQLKPRHFLTLDMYAIAST